MVAIELTREHAYVIALVVAFYIQQAILFVIPVARARSRVGLKPPSLYPRDSEIKALKMSPEDVVAYNCAQRQHQNNQEFLTVFLPLLLCAGVLAPTQAAYAGAIVWCGRFFVSCGYLMGPQTRALGAWFHIPEVYLLYTVGRAAWTMIQN